MPSVLAHYGKLEPDEKASYCNSIHFYKSPFCHNLVHLVSPPLLNFHRLKEDFVFSIQNPLFQPFLRWWYQDSRRRHIHLDAEDISFKSLRIQRNRRRTIIFHKISAFFSSPASPFT